MRGFPARPGFGRESGTRDGRESCLFSPSVPGQAVRRAFRFAPVLAARGLPRQGTHRGAHARRRASIAKRKAPSVVAIAFVFCVVSRVCTRVRSVLEIDVVLRLGCHKRDTAVDSQTVLAVPAREHVPRCRSLDVTRIMKGRVGVEEVGWHRTPVRCRHHQERFFRFGNSE